MTNIRVYLARIDACKSLTALSDVARGIESDRKLGGKDRIVIEKALENRNGYLKRGVITL